MSKEEIGTTMRKAAVLVCAAGAALLAGCAGNPLIQVDYHNSRPPLTGQPADEAARRAQGTVPLTSPVDGARIERGPYTQSGPVQAFQNEPQGQRTIDGFVVTYHQVPGTSLSMATLVRGGQEAKACYPGDEVQTINTRPNATISVNAEKSVCLHIARNNQVVAYDPIPLPYDQAILSGANPWTAAENGRTRYVANAYSQQRAETYGYMPRLPTAITERGQFVPSGFPIWVGRNAGFTRVDLKGFTFTAPDRPGAAPTGGVVNLQSAPSVK